MGEVWLRVQIPAPDTGLKFITFCVAKLVLFVRKDQNKRKRMAI